MPSAKYVRGYLSSLGLNDIGDALCERCNRTWGDGNWGIGPAGITVGSVVVVLPQDFIKFVSGTKPEPVIAEYASVVDDDGENMYTSKKKRK